MRRDHPGKVPGKTSTFATHETNETDAKDSKRPLQVPLTPVSMKAAGADEASLLIQAAARSRRDRALLQRSRTSECELDADLAASAVSELLPVGHTFAFCRLSAPSRSISSLSALDRYPHLTSLDLSHNKLRSLAPLAHLLSLRALTVRDNLLLSFDLPVPSGLCGTFVPRGLSFLDIGSNALRHTGRLSEHLDLTDLTLDSNCLTSLAGLAGLRRLRRLSVARNRLSDVSDAQDAFPSLVELDLSHNRLQEVAVLNRIRNLVTLRLSHNRLARLPSLSRHRCLYALEVQHNAIEKMSVVADSLSETLSLRSLSARPNPCYGTDRESRLELLWVLPSLQQLDELPVTTIEKVAAANWHAADAYHILAIRRKYLPYEGLVGRASGPGKAAVAVQEEGPLLSYYRDQHIVP
jgi:hypothetical protein